MGSHPRDLVQGWVWLVDVWSGLDGQDLGPGGARWTYTMMEGVYVVKELQLEKTAKVEM